MKENLDHDDSPKTEAKTSEFKDFTRGGQITLHNIRMYLQIIDKVLWIMLFVFVVVLIGSIYVLTTPYQQYVSGEYVWSLLALFINPEATDKFIQPSGLHTLVKCRDIVHSPLVKQIVNDAYYRLVSATIFSLVVSILSYVGLSHWLKSRGKKHTDDVTLRGDRFVTKDGMRDLLVRKEINSDLVLAGLPLVKNKETAHFFFHGTTGTGKSNAIKELLDQIRKRGDRAIIYDKSCNYLEEFYRPQHDVLLNPLDRRGEPWDLWLECRDAADFDSLAAAQIPMPLSNQDPFWINAARTIFSAAAFEMRHDKDREHCEAITDLING